MSSAFAGLAAVFGAAFVAVGFSADQIKWSYVIGGAASALAGVLFPKDGLLWELIDYRKQLREYREALVLINERAKGYALKVMRLIEQLNGRIASKTVDFDTARMVRELLEFKFYNDDVLDTIAAVLAATNDGFVNQVIVQLKTTRTPLSCVVALTRRLLDKYKCAADSVIVTEMTQEITFQLGFDIDRECLTSETVFACYELATAHAALPQRQYILAQLTRYEEKVNAETKVKGHLK